MDLSTRMVNITGSVRLVIFSSSIFAENADAAATPESVEELIAQIGDVTPEKADAIAKAWNAYSQLDEGSRALVRNIDVLTEAQQVLEIQQALEKLWVQRDVVRDNARGYVWEVADFVATDEDVELLQKIAQSKKTVIRFKGDKNSAQYTVQKKDKELIPLLLHAYDLMSNASTEVQAKALAGIKQKNY